MKGSELLAALQALTPEELDLPVVTPDSEYGYYGSPDGVDVFNDRSEGRIIVLGGFEPSRAADYVPPPRRPSIPGSVDAFLRDGVVGYDPARARELMDFGAAVLGDASVRQDCSGYVSYVVQDGARE